MAVAKMSVAELEAFLRREFPQAFGEGTSIRIERADGQTCLVRERFGERMLRPGGTVSGPTLMALADCAMYVVLLSAIGYALNIIMLRHRATRDPLSQIVLFQNLGPAIILAVPVLWVWTPPSATDYWLFACLGLLGVTAHTMLAHAFARIEAARLAPVGYMTLVWGVLFAVFQVPRSVCNADAGPSLASGDKGLSQRPPPVA